MRERLKVSEGGARMIPAGYMYKQIRLRPDYIKAPHVVDIYSAGECGSDVTSPNFCDYTKYFRQNGFGFFNNPEIMHEVAKLENVDLTALSLFYYEIYELECDFVAEDSWDVHWIPARCESAPLPSGNSNCRRLDLISKTALTTISLSPLHCW